MVLDRSSERPTSATVPNVEIRKIPEADLEIGSEFCDDAAVKQLIDAWLVPRLVDEWLANDDPATQPTQPEDNGNP